MACQNCGNKSDMEKYGFTLLNGAYYWTIIKEIKTCCPIKVKLVNHTASIVELEADGKIYTKGRQDFMASSWRNVDSF